MADDKHENEFDENDDFFDDDFGDESDDVGVSDDDIDFSVDDDADEDDVELSDDTEAEPKKSGNGLLLAAGGGFVVVAGAVLALNSGMMGGDAPAAAPVAQQASAVAQDQVADAGPLEAPTEAVSVAADDFNLDQLEVAGAETDQLPVGTLDTEIDFHTPRVSVEVENFERIQSGESTSTPLDTYYGEIEQRNEMLAAAENTDVNLLGDLEATPSIPEPVAVEAIVPEPAMPEVTVEATSTQPTQRVFGLEAPQLEEAAPVVMMAENAVSEEQFGQVENRIDAVDSSVEDLSDRLSTLERQLSNLAAGQQELLNQMRQNQARSTQVSSSDQGAVHQLGESISALSSRLTGLESQISEASLRQQKAADVAPASQSRAVEAQSEQPAPRSSRAVASQTSSAPKPVSAQRSRPVLPRHGWKILSAQPGSAVVTLARGGSVNINVRPGETLSGVGTVLAIRQIRDRWVVEGTNGMIR